MYILKSNTFTNIILKIKRILYEWLKKHAFVCIYLILERIIDPEF